MRIDPATNAVDLTVDLGVGAGPDNYSDMTGSTLTAPPDTGSWTIVHDTTIPGAAWGNVSWTADTPGDSEMRVFVASSADGATFGPETEATNGAELPVADGQYLRTRAEFTRASTGATPVLYDLTILANRPSDCYCGGHGEEDARHAGGHQDRRGRTCLLNRVTRASEPGRDGSRAHPDGHPVLATRALTDRHASGRRCAQLVHEGPQPTVRVQVTGTLFGVRGGT